MTEPQPLGEGGRAHGRITSWAVVAVAILSFAAGGTALILGAMVIFYLCAAVFVLCVPAGAYVGVMDDTVQWTAPQSKQTQRERN